MKKQAEEISKKYDFFDDDDDDKKDFPGDISVKIEEDFADDNNDDVVIKQENDTEMDDAETIPYASPKKEDSIDGRETILYASLKRESEDEIDEKIYKEPKLETPAEIEIQAENDRNNFLKCELEQNKVDLKLSNEAEIKRVQDVFDEVKQEEPLRDIENFFIDDNDIFNSDEISEADRRFITDLINRTTFTADKKKFVEDKVVAEMEIVDQPTKQKMDKKELNEIANNEKQEGARSENHLMGEVKVKNRLLIKVKKNRKRIRKSYIERVKSRRGAYYETKP